MRICFLLKVRQERLEEYKQATLMSGLRCSMRSVTLAGAITLYSCGPTAFLSAISNATTLIDPAQR